MERQKDALEFFWCTIVEERGPDATFFNELENGGEVMPGRPRDLQLPKDVGLNA